MWLCPELTTEEHAITGLEDERALQSAWRFRFDLRYGQVELFHLLYDVWMGEFIDKVVG